MLHKETEFQDSAIGKIPIDWDVRELGDDSIADLIAGQSPPSSTYNKENRGLPFLQGKMEFGEIFPSPTTHCSKPIKVAEKDDVLLSVRAPVGDVNIAPFKCCIGRGLAAIRPKSDRLSHLFLFHYLRLEGKRFEALSTGSTFKAIRKQEIEKFAVPVPSLVEQRGIVGVLGVVDSAILKVDDVIAKTERLKKGLMQELLTRGIGPKEYKETIIGRIPRQWEVTTLADASVSITDGSHFSPKHQEFGYPLATVANMRENYIDVDSCYRISKEDYENLARSRDKPEINDVLFSKDGTVGLCIVFNQKVDLIVLSSIAIIRPDKEKVNPYFLRYVLQSPSVLSRITGSKTGTAIRRIVLKDLSKVKLPVPKNLVEQSKIVEILISVDKKLELEKSEKSHLKRIKLGLMNLLLNGKIRVKVD